VEGDRARSAEFFGFLGEQLAGTEDVRAKRRGAFHDAPLHPGDARLAARAGAGPHGFAALWGWSILTYLIIGMALVFWLGWQGLQAGTLTIGAVYLVFYYSDMMREPLEQIRQQMEVLQKAGAGIARVEELLAIRPRLDETGTAGLPAGPLAVDLRGLHFAYRDGESNGETVLEGSTWRSPPAGCWASWGDRQRQVHPGPPPHPPVRPTEGEVLLGGTPLPAVAPAALRSRVAMVTQEVQLFRAACGQPDLLRRRHLRRAALEVLFALGLGDWAAGLPQGLDTVLETAAPASRRARPAAGVRPGCSCADRAWWILDEASSRLDPATEALIERAVGRLLAGRTG